MSEVLYRAEDVLKVITENLDRINGTQAGVMAGVAQVWLQDVPTIKREDIEK